VVFSQVGPEEEVFFDGKAREYTPPFGDMGYPEPDNCIG